MARSKAGPTLAAMEVSPRIDASERFCDGLTEVRGGSLAAEVRRLRSLREHGLDRLEHCGTGVLATEMVEHHRAGPDLANRVRDLLPIDVRRRAVHRLEQRRVDALGVQVCGGR